MEDARRFAKVRKSLLYLSIKRGFDFSLALIASVVLLVPISLVLRVVYWLMGDFNSLFYAQERLGKHGKVFKLYKFRSMVPNAEAKLRADHDLYAKYVAYGYKLPIEDDPRVTKIGKFLRKTSLDELPQFLNILKGDMSLIGVRPIIPSELSEYQGTAKIKFLSLRPGAFGYWQASGRSNIEYPERCEFELYYVDNASLKFDFKILWHGVLAMIKQDGAV